MDLKKKHLLRQKRVWRIRRKVQGTTARPRLVVSFSHKHMYAQLIDDVSGHTLVAANTTAKDLRGESLRPNVDGAKKLGEIIGQRAQDKGIAAVAFDRHGRRYHGSIKAFADAARGAGLQF